MNPDAIPDGTVAARKRALRAELRSRLSRVTPEERERDSESIRRRLANSPEWAAAGTVMAFLAMPSEPDLTPALRAVQAAGRTVALPRWEAGTGCYRPARVDSFDHLVPGPLGILEPKPSSPWLTFEQLDLVLVPGLAFDRRGRRLGRGRGYFDRLLAGARQARYWGVAFDLQVIADVPAEPHDIDVHCLVTPAFWLPVAATAATGPA